VKRPAIIFACCLLLAVVACAESVEVGTLKPQESSRNVRIAVLLNGKPLKLARVSFCTVTGAIACFSAYTGNDGVAVPHALALTTYQVVALFEDGLSSGLYLHISPQGKATSFAMDLTPSAPQVRCKRTLFCATDRRSLHSFLFVPGVSH